jgi:hypothetical protein
VDVTQVFYSYLVKVANQRECWWARREILWSPANPQERQAKSSDGHQNSQDQGCHDVDDLCVNTGNVSRLQVALYRTKQTADLVVKYGRGERFLLIDGGERRNTPIYTCAQQVGKRGN